MIVSIVVMVVENVKSNIPFNDERFIELLSLHEYRVDDDIRNFFRDVLFGQRDSKTRRQGSICGKANAVVH